jgi:hypothetical protein
MFIKILLRYMHWKAAAILGYAVLLIIDVLLVVIRNKSWEVERCISNRAVKKCWEDATNLIKQYK